MATPIASYEYTYGAGGATNRKIEFYRDDENPDSLKATVFYRSKGEWKEFSRVENEAINVEMKRTAKKVDKYFTTEEQRSTPRSFDYIEKKANLLTAKDQLTILDQLQPVGKWSVLRTTGTGSDPRIEKVVELTLFNPG